MILLFKQKTAYEMRISDWSSDVCSSDLYADGGGLYLRVRRSQRRHRKDLAPPTRSWLYICTVDGRRREVGLGSILDVSLATARDLASDTRTAFREGRDPDEERRQ